MIGPAMSRTLCTRSVYVLTLHRRVLRTIVDAVWDQCGVALGRDNVLLVRAVAHQACEDGFGAVAFVAAATCEGVGMKSVYVSQAART
jgi:hypothetical protein